jgi:hypothetical protein
MWLILLYSCHLERSDTGRERLLFWLAKRINHGAHRGHGERTKKISVCSVTSVVIAFPDLSYSSLTHYPRNDTREDGRKCGA